MHRILVVGITLGITFLLYAAAPTRERVVVPGPVFVHDSTGLSAKKLADQYCQTCHVLPSPDLLDKATWIQRVFPNMRKVMGLDTIPKEQLDAMVPDVRHLFNTPPLLTEQMWFEIANYYIENAPMMLPKPARPPIGPETPLFAAEQAPWRALTPLFTHVKLDPKQRAIILGDGSQNRLVVCDLNGRRRSMVEMKGPPSSVVIEKDAWYVTDMANLMPHDSAAGALYRVSWNGDSTATAQRLLDSLRRPVHLNITDLNGDGKKEYLICEYGNLLGRLGYYELLPKGKKKYTLLIDRPGAIRTVVQDINGDKRPDIVVLMAQAREGIFALINKGKGVFEQRELLTFHPAFGSSYINMLDFNNDGNMDIIATNGDNGDYSNPPFKPYHGVRIYLGDGHMHFTEHLFLPVNGAYGASVRDFDLDGDLDIVSVAYFANYNASPEEALIFWEHTADGNFLPHRMAKFNAGRWLVFDVADVDGDGDEDVIVANTAYGPGTVPQALQDRWVVDGIPYVLLRNTTNK